MKLEIKKLRREKHILTKSVANVEELRREVYNTQRELLRERTRCKALEEELENPMNIHRWRKLEVKFMIINNIMNSQLVTYIKTSRKCVCLHIDVNDVFFCLR